MHSVTYSMGVSLDGYIVGPHGDFDWSVPDDEEFRFVTDEIRGVGVHLLGRRLYETMPYWETNDQNSSLDFSTLEWAALWKALPKVVFSSTLSALQGNAALPLTAWRRRPNVCEPSGETATSQSAARRSPPKRQRWD